MEVHIMQFRHIFTCLFLAGSLLSTPARAISTPESFDYQMAWNIASPALTVGLMTWSAISLYEYFQQRTRCYDYQLTDAEKNRYPELTRRLQKNGYITKEEQTLVEFYRLNKKITQAFWQQTDENQKSESGFRTTFLGKEFDVNLIRQTSDKDSNNDNNGTFKKIRVCIADSDRRYIPRRQTFTVSITKDEIQKPYVNGNIIEFIRTYLRHCGYRIPNLCKKIDPLS